MNLEGNITSKQALKGVLAIRQGIDGKDGKDGQNGKDGYTPQKGIDYFDGEKGEQGEVSIAYADSHYSPSIITSASGEVIAITDSANVKPNIKLFGKGKQRQYEGNQLLTYPYISTSESKMGITTTDNGDGSISFAGTNADTNDYYYNLFLFEGSRLKLKAGTYTMSIFGLVDGLKFQFHLEFANRYISNGETFTIEEDDEINVYFIVLSGKTVNATAYPMLNKGTTALPWEPFVGNEPSPNMNYPQKAEFLGESGSIGGKVLTGNMYDSSFRKPYDQTIASNGCTVEENNGVFFITATKTDMYVWSMENANIPYNPNYVGCLTPIPNDATQVNVKISNAEINKNFVGYFDENKISLGWTNSNSNEFTQPIKAGAKYVVLRFGKGDAVVGKTYETTVMVNFGEPKDYEPYTEQPFTFQTPNGLRGIDDVRDYVCLESGKRVQRILKIVVDGKSNIFDYDNPKENSNIFGLGIEGIKKDSKVLSNKLINQTVWGTNREGVAVGSNGAISFRLFDNRSGITAEDSSSQKVSKVKSFLSVNPIDIYYYTDEPIITDLTQEEIDQFNALHMNYPNTTIVNDEGAYMEVEYVADTKIYTDNKFKELEAKMTSAIAQLL